MLLLRGAREDRQRGLELLTRVRDMAFQQRYQASELPIFDFLIAREQARGADRDGSISVLRKSVDEMITRGQVGYYMSAIGVLVEALLDRGTEGDVAEAEAAIATLAVAPADGSVIHDVLATADARAARTGPR